MITTKPRKRKWQLVPGKTDQWEYSDFSGEIGRLLKLEKIEGVFYMSHREITLTAFKSLAEANRWLRANTF